ncbi:hypothetical protein [Merismopedia glauca]|uniref:hypothetical protein n=1 Tax=Merismopedia glauca TaxID=292586 RepID=UPI0011B21214|nr:hypothetical protein [Merismopedia glauca]
MFVIDMGRVAKLVPPEKLALAKKNGISVTTVYKRLQRGWDIDKAISEQPRENKRQRDRNDEGLFTGVGKGKTRTFKIPKQWDEKLDLAIADSDLTLSEWVAEVIVNKLKGT